MDSAQYHDDELRRFISSLPVERPSVGFSSRVMEQVMLQAQHAAHRRRIARTAWIATIPCLLMILAVVGFTTRNYWTEAFLRFFEPLFTSLGSAFSSISGLFAGGKGGNAILLGITVLALLLGDLFIRRYAERKKQWL